MDGIKSITCFPLFVEANNETVTGLYLKQLFAGWKMSSIDTLTNYITNVVKSLLVLISKVYEPVNAIVVTVDDKVVPLKIC